MAKPETKFWQYWKKNTPDIIWTRLENMSSFGTPDLLGYNKNHFFFTVELKVANGNSVRLSPHQIAFHLRHPKNSFILVKSPAACGLKLWAPDPTNISTILKAPIIMMPQNNSSVFTSSWHPVLLPDGRGPRSHNHNPQAAL